MRVASFVFVHLHGTVGVPFTTLSQILPFILIGIGVDDMVSAVFGCDPTPTYSTKNKNTNDSALRFDVLYCNCALWQVRVQFVVRLSRTGLSRLILLSPSRSLPP